MVQAGTLGELKRSTYVLEYTPDALAPGDYTLRVALGEERRRVQAYTLMRVRPRS